MVCEGFVFFVRDTYIVSTDDTIADKDRRDYVIIFILGMVFLIVPWLLNVSHILRDSKKIEKVIVGNPNAKEWFSKRRQKLAWLVALSGGLYPTLTFVSSRMFGLEFLNFSLTQSDLSIFEGVKLKYTGIIHLIIQKFSNHAAMS